MGVFFDTAMSLLQCVEKPMFVDLALAENFFKRPWPEERSVFACILNSYIGSVEGYWVIMNKNSSQHTGFKEVEIKMFNPGLKSYPVVYLIGEDGRHIVRMPGLYLDTAGDPELIPGIFKTEKSTLFSVKNVLLGFFPERGCKQKAYKNTAEDLLTGNISCKNAYKALRHVNFPLNGTITH